MIIKSPHYTFENWRHIFWMNIKVRALRSCSLISSWLAISSVRVSGALVCDGMLIGHAQKKIWCQKHAINSQSPKEKRHPLESTIHHPPPKTTAGLYLECWLKLPPDHAFNCFSMQWFLGQSTIIINWFSAFSPLLSMVFRWFWGHSTIFDGHGPLANGAMVSMDRSSLSQKKTYGKSSR